MSGDNATLVILAKSISNLLKKDVVTKPTSFSPSTISASQHVDIVENYCEFIQSTSNIEKALVLWDTLSDSIKNEIIFDSEYDAKKENFDWLSNKLKLLFPSKSNKISDLIQLNQIKQNNRSLKGYVSTIKQECAKRRSNFSTSELHTAALSIFINGLHNELFCNFLK